MKWLAVRPRRWIIPSVPRAAPVEATLLRLDDLAVRLPQAPAPTA